ncbi:uncharacterized mitochondrial protein AtMg00310-like [Rutidosis leptorrhynchoides]|uniref:uncharacterized mitochondrial protein AtMg00310-like n=1 Tax=Rutidosis leptorrhynchoides TaxID=125765 RepID=UPI003A9A0034
MCWVKWEDILLPYGSGGLNLGSLKCKNLALIAKWWWRFHTEPTALWVKVIKSIFGSSGGIGSGTRFISNTSAWSCIINTVEHLDSFGVPFRDSFSKVIGDGVSTSFWNDKWLGDD